MVRARLLLESVLRNPPSLKWPRLASDCFAKLYADYYTLGRWADAPGIAQKNALENHLDAEKLGEMPELRPLYITTPAFCTG